ncbi:GatB/GatE catalytic domain-containing protein [Paraphoma chrysanthemicola]|uniref:Glutamyl-tRNA(Gln) amidotransferase subunit B, mitochondrial n=1 Tax=Paraphoma chrysanthemicola TaxID=798071 RepID=A0A8K0VWD1_9PLEO|nr:GatB/GatE catalytic domain-containing protein [Paraphoma chrysanthemicola]
MVRLHTMLNTRSAFAVLSRRPYICQACLRRTKRAQLAPLKAIRTLQTNSQSPQPSDTPFRKALKDASKQQKKEKRSNGGSSRPSQQELDPRLEKWELTVGIEIHAELNTARKLFSGTATSIGAEPNSHVSLFDVAFPGSQPHFQKETLIPALRGALALNCTIQRKSSFDRKHYFYQDQPAGYQITQYYEPFARDGHIILYAHDFPPGTAPAECPITIGIKQVQMEQDTAKTVQQPPSTHLLDFNRVSHPLIEIITLPQIHDPTVAAVCVRKIQTILKTVNACTAGMEMGGLRADVNVSVRERSSEIGEHSYYGVTGLGQRTEIKNLASVKAVEDAIVAERDRQIDLLESGGAVEGETRGWTLGSKTTKRLRGKEGEIDYRYMPDPDIASVILGEDLISHLRTSLPKLPDTMVDTLTEHYGLSTKDAGTLLSLDDGDRLDYFFGVMERLCGSDLPNTDQSHLGRIAGNWVLMELGSLFKDLDWDPSRVTVEHLAFIITQLQRKNITSRSAKKLLLMKFEGDARPMKNIIDEENLTLTPLSTAEYEALARALVDEKPDMVKDIVEKGQEKKVKWFVGQMMARSAEGSVEPDVAETVLRKQLGLTDAGPVW